ncbi:MAG: hypothetical protein QM736_14665 [Vicinamibacterales bacterium]
MLRDAMPVEKLGPAHRRRRRELTLEVAVPGGAISGQRLPGRGDLLGRQPTESASLTLSPHARDVASYFFFGGVFGFFGSGLFPPPCLITTERTDFFFRALRCFGVFVLVDLDVLVERSDRFVVLVIPACT